MSSSTDSGPASPPSKQTDRRVLIVEDNADAAETMQLMLSLSGYEARTAHDGDSALAAAREFRPQVVLLDIGLPGRDGYQVARALRGLPETERALLVALTGYGQDEDRQRATDAGFDSYQVKPVDPQALETLLSAHFGRVP